MDINTATRRTTFQRQVLDRLGLDICTGQYQPGQILPSESELCERFAFSRIVIREAVKSLAAKGMLDVRRKVGTMVLGPSEWNLFDPDIILWRTQTSGADREMSRDLMELRGIVEPAAARLAALRATDEEREAILAAFESMRKAVQGDGDYVSADLAFHTAILASSGNQFVRQMKVGLSAVLRRGFEIVSRKPGGPQGSLAAHEVLCRHIIEGNAEAAQRAALALIEHAIRDMQDCFENESVAEAT